MSIIELLQLSRYIHRNPIETKQPIVKKLEYYQWSSYPAYINHVRDPEWLKRDTSYGMLGNHQHYKGYKAFVESGNDSKFDTFYIKKTLKPILGSDCSVEDLLKHRDNKITPHFAKSMEVFSTIETIVRAVSTKFNQDRAQGYRASLNASFNSGNFISLSSLSLSPPE